MATQKMTSSYDYKTLRDLAEIVRVFNTFSVEERSVMEISKAVKMSPSKISKMIRTWESEGFFEKNPENGKYRLGFGFFELGVVYAFHLPLRKIVRPHIEQISKELNITTSYAIFKNGKPIIVDRIQSVNIDLFPYRVGFNLPVHSTSVGKILLAYLPEEEQDKIFGSYSLMKFTDSTVVDINSIKENLRLVRERDYATDEGETYKDWNCISASIRNGNGDVIGAITLIDEESRTSVEKLFSLNGYLKEKALFISRQLGFGTHL
jgi:DNA-binding IclR family transcriptional regulator